jgi:hypothetical protein
VKLALALVLSLGLAACAHLEVGRPIDKSRLNEVLPGRTTKPEVLGLLGEPLHRAPGPAGEIFVYRYVRGTDVSQELVISFSEDVVCVLREE